jgi:hypothetical protein
MILFDCGDEILLGAVKVVEDLTSFGEVIKSMHVAEGLCPAEVEGLIIWGNVRDSNFDSWGSWADEISGVDR